MSRLPSIKTTNELLVVLQVNLIKQGKQGQVGSKLVRKLGDRYPTFIDGVRNFKLEGVHSFKLEDDYVLIDLFVLKSTAEDQFGREKTAQLKIPLDQFCYFAKTMARLADQLPSEIQQTRRTELTLIRTR